MTSTSRETVKDFLSQVQTKILFDFVFYFNFNLHTFKLNPKIRIFMKVLVPVIT